jgi:hypothetical protein
LKNDYMTNQRWEEGRMRWRSDRETIRPSEYDVAEIADDRTARAFVALHHYSREYVAARYRFGLYRLGRLAGVAVFSQPVNDRSVTKVFPIHPKEGVELGRLVLLDEVAGNGESWFVSRAFELLRKKEVADKEGRDLRGILGVVSFSDPMPRRSADGRLVLPGHLGTVYQALNSVYLGRADARTLRLLPDGTVFSHRAEEKIRNRESGWEGAAAKLERYGAEPVRKEDPKGWLKVWLSRLTRPLVHRGNHKYCWAFDPRLRDNLRPSGPYPKLKDPEAV